jgi:hypothetical protein
VGSGSETPGSSPPWRSVGTRPLAAWSFVCHPRRYRRCAKRLEVPVIQIPFPAPFSEINPWSAGGFSLVTPQGTVPCPPRDDRSECPETAQDSPGYTEVTLGRDGVCALVAQRCGIEREPPSHPPAASMARSCWTSSAKRASRRPEPGAVSLARGPQCRSCRRRRRHPRRP